jgi:hypothetical protein
MIGILVDALIAELILDAFMKPSMLAFTFARAGAVLDSGSAVHHRCGVVWTQPAAIWLDLLDLGNRLFGLPSQAAI